MEKTRAKTYVFIAIMVALGPLANVLFKEGMKHVGVLRFGSVPMAVISLAHVFLSPSIWLGIAARISFTVAYMLLLSWADYTYVTPVSAISYGVVAVMGFFLLGETVSPTRWAGVLLICLGVAIAGSTPVRTT